MPGRRILIPLIAWLILAWPEDVHAWGPATHVKLASDLLSQSGALPAALASLLSRRVRDYLFGNIAADVVLAKRLSKIKQFCHHWETGFAILADARSDAGRAFGYGYLSHLAADTVAHNKFLPRQMTVTGSTVSFGHLYWELRADSTIGPHYWDLLRGTLDDVFAEHEVQLSSKMKDTFLPFSVNWRLFYRMNRFVGQNLWRRALDRWYLMSRWSLSDQLMREYRAECIERMLDVVCNERNASVLHEDPNGNASLAYTRVQKRQLRQMARAGHDVPHMLIEAAAGHAPGAARSHSSAPPDISRRRRG